MARVVSLKPLNPHPSLCHMEVVVKGFLGLQAF